MRALGLWGEQKVRGLRSRPAVRHALRRLQMSSCQEVVFWLLAVVGPIRTGWFSSHSVVIVASARAVSTRMMRPPLGSPSVLTLVTVV